MSRNKLPGKDVEEMLRRAFRDDMPAGLEEEMLRRFETFWFRASQTRTAPRGGIAAARHAFLPHLLTTPGLRRFLLAASALVMLIAGGALRIGQSSSFLADSIALKQTAASVVRRLHLARQMHCRLEMFDDRGNPLLFSISWAEGADTTVEIEGAGSMERLSVAAESVQASVLSPPERIPAGKSPRTPLQDARLKPIVDFLFPPALARLLSGQWRPPASAGAGQNEPADYTVVLPGDRVALVRVDQSTFFPSSLAVFPADSAELRARSRPLLSARFQWQPPSIPDRESR